MGGAGVTGEFAGEIRVDALQDAGAQQHVTHRGRLGVENLVDQITSDGAVFGLEFLHELLGIGMPVQRQRGQPYPRHPAFGPPGESLDRRLGQGDALMRQEQAGLLDVEGQVVGPDLGELPGQPVPVQGQQRVHPRGNDQMQAWMGVPLHVVQGVQSGRICHQVKIVEDQDDGRVLDREHRGQPDQERMLHGLTCGPGEDPRHENACPPQGSHDIRPEHPRLVVIVVEGDPGQDAGVRAGGGPGGDSHGLACSRRPGDRGQRAASALGDELLDARAGDRPARQFGHDNFGHQDRIVSVGTPAESGCPSGLGTGHPRFPSRNLIQSAARPAGTVWQADPCFPLPFFFLRYTRSHHPRRSHLAADYHPP